MNARQAGIAALIVGILVGALGGYFAGYRKSERELRSMAFINAVGRISTSATTLRLIEQERETSISKQHEIQFKSAIHDALLYGADDLVQIPGSIPSLHRSLAEAEAYAERRNWNDVAAQLRVIQQVLSASQSDRT